jgi:hypothetical protein
MTHFPKQPIVFSIVGADAFHFSVRNGKRWCHIAQITRKFLFSNAIAPYPPKLNSNLLSTIRIRLEESMCGGSSSLEAPRKVKRIGKKYFSTISTGKLNALLHFHRPPINLVIFKGSFLPYGRSRSYLGDGFPLRCFQRLSDGNLATRRCSISSKQPAHQGFPHPSPLVLGTALLKFPTVVLDRVRTVSRRS